jgi:hypothetical protein
MLACRSGESAIAVEAFMNNAGQNEPLNRRSALQPHRSRKSWPSSKRRPSNRDSKTSLWSQLVMKMINGSWRQRWPPRRCSRDWRQDLLDVADHISDLTITDPQVFWNLAKKGPRK